MPHSLRVRLKKIYEKGLDHYLLTDRDVERLIHALDVVDAIEDIKAEIKSHDDQKHYPYGVIGIRTVLQIIDKHIWERGEHDCN